MAITSIPQTISKLRIGTADKLILTNLFNAQADDIEVLRASVAALTAKLDAAGASVAGLGTNFNATVGVPTAKMSLRK